MGDEPVAGSGQRLLGLVEQGKREEKGFVILLQQPSSELALPFQVLPF